MSKDLQYTLSNFNIQVKSLSKNVPPKRERLV
jgi:hypothetical protein